jgi:putative DNA primase/helicase
MPYNPVSGKDYRGMNAVVLLMTAEMHGYGDPRWMTYRQAAELGGQVRRGEKSTSVQYWKWREEQPVIGLDGRPVLADGVPVVAVVELTRPRVFGASVFNGAQIDGLEPALPRPVLPEWQRHESAEAIIAGSAADIRHISCDRAAYHRARDFIILPEKVQFPSADGYYSTALHELGHWTGHESRLARDMAHPFGSGGYAREELRAEIASMMLGDRLGIGYNPEQHVSYIGHYVDILSQNPKEIFSAASDAEKIVSFLRSFERTQDLHQNAATRQEITVMPVATARPESSEQVPGRVYLAVPFSEKNQAKTLGARWDKAARCWFAPPGVDPAPLARWRQQPVSRQLPDDPRLEFADALQTAGLLLGGLPVMDGKLHRVRVEGDKAGARSGAYIGHLDGYPSGFIQNFRAGLKQNWKSQLPREALSGADRARLLAEAAEKKRVRDEQRREIAAETVRLVEAHLDGMPQLGARVAHPYLERKGVGAHGIYLNTAGPLTLFAGEDRPQLWSAQGELIVTICDLDGKLLGAQSITTDGRKSITRGAVIVGGHHLLGEVTGGGQLMIAEGYSTAATLHEASGLPVAVAFHAGNLAPVAAAYRDRFPDLRLYICGDNDHRAERELGADGKPRENVGRVKAETAAATVGGVAMVPSFDPDDEGSDWNDLAQTVGTEFKAALGKAIAAAERQLAAVAAREASGVAAEQAQSTRSAKPMNGLLARSTIR